MKKVKIVFWLLLLGVIVIVVAQNLDFFLKRYAVGIDIGLVSYHTPNLATAIYLLFFFFTGGLIVFLMGLSERFTSKKTIRELKDTIAAENKKVMDLEARLSAIQSGISQGHQVEKQPDSASL
jgi:hypothetical protein